MWNRLVGPGALFIIREITSPKKSHDWQGQNLHQLCNFTAVERHTYSMPEAAKL